MIWLMKSKFKKYKPIGRKSPSKPDSFKDYMGFLFIGPKSLLQEIDQPNMKAFCIFL